MNSKISPRKIGLTGATGVLGRTLKLAYPEIQWENFTGNLRNFNEVKEWYFSLSNLDGIVHLAALVPTHLVESEPLKALQVNVNGTVHLLESIRLRHIKTMPPWVFFASSSHVYGSDDQPLSEDSALHPISLYGMTKLQAESWVLEYQRKYGIPICTGRIFSYSSPLQPPSFFIPSLIHQISRCPINGKLEFMGLQGTRDFLTAEAVAQGINDLFQRRATGIFNLASGKKLKLSQNRPYNSGSDESKRY